MRDKMKVICVCVSKMKRKKNEREVTDRYTVNNRNEQQCWQGLVRFQPLIYCVEKKEFYVYLCLSWRSKNEEKKGTDK